MLESILNFTNMFLLLSFMLFCALFRVLELSFLPYSPLYDAKRKSKSIKK